MGAIGTIYISCLENYSHYKNQFERNGIPISPFPPLSSYLIPDPVEYGRWIGLLSAACEKHYYEEQPAIYMAAIAAMGVAVAKIGLSWTSDFFSDETSAYEHLLGRFTHGEMGIGGFLEELMRHVNGTFLRIGIQFGSFYAVWRCGHTIAGFAHNKIRLYQLNKKLGATQSLEEIEDLKKEAAVLCQGLLRNKGSNPRIFDDSKNLIYNLADEEMKLKESEQTFVSAEEGIGSHLNQGDIKELLKKFDHPYESFPLFAASKGIFSIKDLDNFLVKKKPNRQEWNKASISKVLSQEFKEIFDEVSSAEPSLLARLVNTIYQIKIPLQVAQIVKIANLAVCLFSFSSLYFGKYFWIGLVIGTVSGLRGRKIERKTEEFSKLYVISQLFWINCLNPWIYFSNAVALSIRTTIVEGYFPSPLTTFYHAYLS